MGRNHLPGLVWRLVPLLAKDRRWGPMGTHEMMVLRNSRGTQMRTNHGVGVARAATAASVCSLHKRGHVWWRFDGPVVGRRGSRQASWRIVEDLALAGPGLPRRYFAASLHFFFVIMDWMSTGTTQRLAWTPRRGAQTTRTWHGSKILYNIVLHNTISPGPLPACLPACLPNSHLFITGS
jgi:hypothetical protein